MSPRKYRDRRDAGRALVPLLAHYGNRQDVLVLALPRGGVPVAFEVARALAAPLDVLVVRKLGIPGQEEYAMGAIASGGLQVLNEALIREAGLSSDEVERVATVERIELARRERLYRGDRPPPEVAGRTVIIVDDGLATGYTMRAAVHAVRHMKPARIIVAVPTAAADTCEAMKNEADEVVCADTPHPFHAVGLWYDHFDQTGDEEVKDLLARAGP